MSHILSGGGTYILYGSNYTGNGVGIGKKNDGQVAN